MRHCEPISFLHRRGDSFVLALEPDLHRELENSRIVCGEDSTEVRGTEARSRIVEVRVVDQVEGFAARLEAEALGQAEGPHERCVEVQLRRSGDYIAAEVAEGADGRS